MRQQNGKEVVVEMEKMYATEPPEWGKCAREDREKQT